VSRNFGEKRLTGVVFPDVARVLDTVWVDGILYKLTILNFPLYFVKTISSCLKLFKMSFQRATSTCRPMQAGVAQGGIIAPNLFSLYVNDTPSPFLHIKLALYAEDTAIISMSHQQALNVRYLETYLSDLELWLRI
jgi:hypothetical protein